jgi:hypothetical protein
LKPPLGQFALQASHEQDGIGLFPLTNKVMENQFAVYLSADKDVLITARHVVNRGVLLQAINERIQLVNFNVFDLHALDSVVQQPGTLAASGFKDAQDRAPVKLCEAFNGSDAHSLTEQMNHLAGFFKVHPQIVQRAGGNVGKGFAACFAAIPLKPVLNTEFECFRLASVTRHLDSFWPKN